MKKINQSSRNECGVTFNQWVKNLKKQLEINYLKLGLIKKI